MYESLDLLLKGAALAAACSILDFPATHMEKSGRIPGSRFLQLAYSVSGGIGSLVLIAAAAVSVYFMFTLGFFVGAGLLISIVVTNRLFVALASTIAASPKVSRALMPVHPVLVVVGSLMLFASGWTFMEYMGWVS